LFSRVFLLCLSLFTMSCSNQLWKPYYAPTETNRILKIGELEQHRMISGGHSLFVAIRKPTRNAVSGEPIRIYLEGDGYAWVDAYTPSANPTPKKHLVLSLAAIDPSDRVVYLARPCQYILSRKDHPECQDERLWTSYRYSEDVLAALSEAIDQIKTRFGSSEKIQLIGYSGGGNLAVLLADRRRDVVSVLTIAANLDLETFESSHQLRRSIESLSAVDLPRSSRVRALSQCHLYGEMDSVVKPEVSGSYLAKLKPTGCAERYGIKKATHQSGWLTMWPDLMDLCRCL